MPKLTFISDTHNKHGALSLKPTDFLIHTGDLTSKGTLPEVAAFLYWFNQQPAKHKVFIAGNHDFGFEHGFEIDQEFKDMGVIYLQDSEVTIDGVKFYGSPWQPEFYDWAFNLPRGEKLAEKWSKIPGNTDVLITHGPVYGLLDYAPHGGHVGCEELYKRVFDVKPKIHVCGHIHGAYGQKSIDGVEFLNASVLDERYEHAHKPIVVEFDIETKEITYA